MTESEVEALRREMLAEFRALNSRLAKMEVSLLDGFDGVHTAIDGIASRLLRTDEANAVRANLKKSGSQPEIADRP
jgi:hypothetical protein